MSAVYLPAPRGGQRAVPGGEGHVFDSLMRILPMTHTDRVSAFAGAMAAALCVATLSPLSSGSASAQELPSATVIRSYYGTDSNSYSGFGAGRYGSAIYQSGGYRMYGQGVYGGMPQGYTGYGNGPYAYGAPVVGTYPSYYSPYGYRSVPAYSPGYGGALPFLGRVYRPVYNPNGARLYMPYGYGR